MTDLTEQWKKGELPVGEYYLLYKDGTTDREYHDWANIYGRVTEKGFSTYPNDIVEVLAPVPSYDELQLMNEAVNQALAANAKLQERVSKLEKMQYSYTPEEWNTMLRKVNRTSEQNAQLKELLKECKPYIGFDTYEFDEKVSKLITKIDEALK